MVSSPALVNFLCSSKFTCETTLILKWYRPIHHVPQYTVSSPYITLHLPADTACSAIQNLIVPYRGQVDLPFITLHSSVQPGKSFDHTKPDSGSTVD